ncbi:MAG TPA: DNA mismatch repair endonuclease MutL [Bacteroides sp.]|nr:DNA mismatch repair endonuclease MutL [Bacteroides sp.]
MPDIVKLLPDSVANQIAAGEVIQRPASVVKELMENAIDAGATTIKVNIKEAGRTLIQIVDNGCGMSPTDARMAFERHATSKITNAKDLFAIRTLGFRGEALASIAAISEVELKTRRVGDDLGTEIRINGSEVQSEEPVSCSTGSNFQVKNLFYNVPARRKFLKANTTEFRHIVNEFYKVVLTNPGLSFYLSHNASEIYNLQASQIKQRIINVFGKNLNQVLLPVRNETSIVTLSGYIGKPESAKKSFGEQFFFVNNRYMRHPYFHKAVMAAYERVLPPDTIPSYFLYFDASTESIDINIHPTKTEVKFEDERSIYQIVHAATREVLGKHSMIPSLDFDREGDIDIPILKKDTHIIIPQDKINPDYNPFDEDMKSGGSSSGYNQGNKENLTNWESLYRDLEKAEATISEAMQESAGPLGEPANLLQFKRTYILLAVKSGLMVVDQKRAHERILYEKYIVSMKQKEAVAQQELYPKKVDLDAGDHALLIEIFDDICRLGFDIHDAGGHSVEIKGAPADLNMEDPKGWIEQFISDYKEREADIREESGHKVAAAMAKNCSIRAGKVLQQEEMREIMDQLFACSEPGTTSDGKAVFRIQPMEDIEKLFN